MCLFCKIINKEIPANVVYEDDDVLAFLDINPTSLGHTLVIPKQHCTNILDSNDLVSIKVLREISNRLLDKLEGDGIKILVNNNEVAGQEVMHLHFHLVLVYESARIDKLDFEKIMKVLEG